MEVKTKKDYDYVREKIQGVVAGVVPNFKVGEVLLPNYDHVKDECGSTKAVDRFVKQAVAAHSEKGVSMLEADLRKFEKDVEKAKSKLHKALGSDLGKIFFKFILTASCLLLSLCSAAIIILALCLIKYSYYRCGVLLLGSLVIIIYAVIICSSFLVLFRAYLGQNGQQHKKAC